MEAERKFYLGWQWPINDTKLFLFICQWPCIWSCIVKKLWWLSKSKMETERQTKNNLGNHLPVSPSCGYRTVSCTHPSKLLPDASSWFHVCLYCLEDWKLKHIKNYYIKSKKVKLELHVFPVLPSYWYKILSVCFHDFFYLCMIKSHVCFNSHQK